MENQIDLEITSQVKSYIQQNWQSLRRDHQHIMAALSDPKMPPAFNQQHILYISKHENRKIVYAQLKAVLPSDTLKKIQIKTLPDDFDRIKWHGLLYLPYPYVVPGGRFNEMYGWDSYFIVLGLLHNNEVIAAQEMVDNSIYQIQHYGKILNANRTYSLDRSQPPLLTQMILAVYRKTLDKHWLQSSLDAIEKYYQFWIDEPHGIPELGLSRYYSFSDKPAIEVIYSEIDSRGLNHYQRVAEYYQTYHANDPDIKRFYRQRTDKLTADFYRSDRSARESGFDPSSRFGQFGAETTDFAAVCLNSLLYQMELDCVEIYKILKQSKISKLWQKRANNRAAAINRYCWNEEFGYYFDYNIKHHFTRPYLFATTFWPLWAGIASNDQAERVIKNLAPLEAPGGLLTSAYVTGDQWDAPFGWAPMHYFAVKGLLRYGHREEAERLSGKFIQLVNAEFIRCGSLFEKYDVNQQTANVSMEIKFGYQSNEIGFGWTNGTYLELLHCLGLHV